MKTQMHIIRLQKTQPRGIGSAQNQGKKQTNKHMKTNLSHCLFSYQVF